MNRLLLCLPLCLCMAPNYADTADRKTPPAPVIVDDGTALPKADALERLAKADVIAFLEMSLRRYNREVKGYSGVLQKQELIAGKLYPSEVIDFAFREKPYSVYMEWKQGGRQADRVMYVEGENGDQLLARPSGGVARLVAGDVVSRDVDGAEARSSGRYTLKEFGLKNSTVRTLIDWKAAREANDLQVEYLGRMALKEAGDRPCWTLRRTLKQPDKNGVSEAILYFDTDNWLQIGTVLKDDKGNLLGAYYHRDVKLNPEFKKGQFERAALIP